MRTPLLAGNWKMNTTPTEAIAWVGDLLATLKREPIPRVQLALHVPFTHLHPLSKLAMAGTVALGAQDVSQHAKGAHTGEVSAAMLSDLGTQMVLVGHSERRADHAESDALVAAKAATAMGAAMVPVICVGEREEERTAGRHEAVVRAQLEGSLAGLNPEHAHSIVVAYEPVWAIGTGRTASASDAQAMCQLCRNVLSERFGDIGTATRVLYGGSVKSDNAAELFSQADIDGGLVGGASLDLASYLAIAQAASR
jgi:triosephosphate isomerase